MSKFHINKHGVPAPCKATKGNCPLGGDETHFSSQEEAQAAADKINEAEYGHLPEMASEQEKTGLSDKEVAKVGKRLTGLIGKRKNAVQEPDFPDGKDTFRSIDDLETLVLTRKEYITTKEHDPVENVQSMFDHVANKSGKLYRYGEGNPHLETHNYNFDDTIRRHRDFLESEEYFNADYYGYDGPVYDGVEIETDEDLRNNFEADVAKHAKLHEYTQNLAVEYGKDFEKKVATSGKYSLDEQNKIQGEYKKALADKVGQFIQNYGE